MTGDARGPRILGIVEGDPVRPLTLSGVPLRLLDALDTRFTVVDRVDYGVRGARRAITAAMTFRPRRSSWVARFHLTPRAYRALTKTLAHRLENVRSEFDIVFQIHGWVGGQPQPYVLYVDQTRSMAEKGWPGWFPMSARERAEARALEQAMYAEAMQIFVMGAPARESLIGDYEIDSARITITGGGVNFASLPASRAEPVRAPSILFIGKEFELKGGRVLLDAFQTVRRAIPDAELHIVGPRERFTEPGVVCHGRLADRAQVADRFRQARVFCLPSLHEGWGLAFAEAMAFGIPCIGADVGSIPEILDAGRAGVLVPPGDRSALGDALVELLIDDDRAHRLGVSGRGRVEEHFTWDRVVERMVPVLTSCGGAAADDD